MKFFRLKQFRTDRKLTQAQFAQRLGIAQSTTSYIESGFQDVTDFMLDRIADVFGLDDLTEYVYQRNSYVGHPTCGVNSEITCRFDGDWCVPSPMSVIDNIPVVCQIGQFHIGFDGTMVIDFAKGVEFEKAPYIIDAHRLRDTTLLLALTSKKGFNDNLYEDFKRAYVVACGLAHTMPVQQVRQYVPQYT